MYPKPDGSIGRALIICYNYENDKKAKPLPYNSETTADKVKTMLRGINFKVDVQSDSASTPAYQDIKVCTKCI